MQKNHVPGMLTAATLVILCTVLATSQAATTPPTRTPLSAAFKAKSFEDFAAAIHLHESDGRVGRIYGDGGRSYGPLQISYKAWRDAIRFDPSIGGKYQDCSRLEYSTKVMLAYLKHHDAKAVQTGDWEACARLWNSGPAWRSKMAKTNEYWAAVRTYLAQGNS